MKSGAKTVAIAWLIAAVYYFYQYMLRSAPAVMMPQMAGGFGLTGPGPALMGGPVSFTHLRPPQTVPEFLCRLLL